MKRIFCCFIVIIIVVFYSFLVYAGIGGKAFVRVEDPNNDEYILKINYVNLAVDVDYVDANGTITYNLINIDSSGNVGINESSPVSQFQVTNSASDQVVAIVKGASGQAVDYLQVRDSDNNSLMVLDMFGNFGIGADMPALGGYSLEVIGSAWFQAPDSDTVVLKLETIDGVNDPVLYFDSNGIATVTMGIYSIDGSFRITSGSGTLSGTNYFVIDPNGYIGIGTAAPEATLDVRGRNIIVGGNHNDWANLTDNTQKTGHFTLPHYDNEEQEVLAIYGNNGSTSNIVSFGGGASQFNAATTIKFYTAANTTTTTGTERMMIDNSGNVGIGTTDPAKKLQVVNSASGDGIQVRAAAVTDDYVSEVGFRMTTVEGATNWAGMRAIRTNSPDSGDTDLRFFAYNGSPNEYVTILADGYVGIGTTAPSDLLEVSGPAGSPAVLNLNTEELTVVDGDKLGQIDFAAPLESSFGDANTVGASIWAEAEETFDATNNGTALVFATGDSEVATERMRINKTGAVGIGLEPTANMVGLSIEDGLLTLKERATPTADTNYGKVYTKTDNELYFQDGAGNEHKISVTEVDYAGMYWNNNGNPSVLETANTPILIRQCTTGDVEGWTFDAGSTGAIVEFSDAGDGKVRVHSATHGLEAGDEVSIRGTTNYNGVFTVSDPNTNFFSITDTWVADDGASDWDEGSHLVCGTGSAGRYLVNWSVSVTEGGGAGSNIVFQIYVNATSCSKCVGKRKFANNDYGSISSHSIRNFAEGDKLYFAATSDGTNSITIQYGNVTLNRI